MAKEETIPVDGGQHLLDGLTLERTETGLV
jgi:hypothetical protein